VFIRVLYIWSAYLFNTLIVLGIPIQNGLIIKIIIIIIISGLKDRESERN
jgi:hypothetical protein